MDICGSEGANPRSTTAAGFKAEVPTKVDLLIVGSSCVDFSTLNPKKKRELANSPLFPSVSPVDPANPTPPLAPFIDSIEDIVGESAVTFIASMKYLLRVRPKLVVLENVNTAPWRNIAGDYFPMAQYHATYVSVDSKDYGVPQTRQRGYCVAADFLHYGEHAKDIVEEWAKIVVAIAPRTQIPLEKLLLRPGDRAVREMEIPIERGSCREPSAKATMCNMRHKDARELFCLPELNPITGIDARGTCKPDDRIFGGWIQKQGPRVCDLLDISFMRVLNHHAFDLRFKLHIIDLSQNVDRSLGHVGQSPCVTPAGIQFLTGQGRPLLGSETLALQGIDSSKLVPSTESEKDWRDLAGNAMTTTVIGSAILALIVAESNVCRSKDIGLEEPAHDVIDDFRGEGRAGFYVEDMEEISEPYNRELLGVNVGHLLDLYKRSRSYCPCDGLGIRNRANHLSVCKDCGEIRCKFCAGNPQHDFEPYTIDFKLNSQTETTQLLSSLFPPKFTLATKEGEPGLRVPTIDSFDSHRGSDVIRKAFVVCCESVTYHYESCHVGQDLTVFYTSERAFAHVVISAAAVTWTIYMDLQKYKKLLPGEAVRVPCLRAVMAKSELSHIPSTNDWLLWVDDKHQVEVNINGASDRMASVKYDILSIKNKEGSEDVDHRVFNCVRDALAEKYELTEKCGTSHGILYSSRPLGLYHFMQPHPSEPGKNDRFVIAGTNRPLELFEQREPVLIFPPNFRPIDSKWERIHKHLALQKGRADNEGGSVEDLGKTAQPRKKGRKTTVAKVKAVEASLAMMTPPAETNELKALVCEFPGLWVHATDNSNGDTVMTDRDSLQQIAPRDLILASLDPLRDEFYSQCQVWAKWLHIVLPLKDISWKNDTHPTLWKPAPFDAPDDDDDALMVPEVVWRNFFEVSAHNHDDLLSTLAFAFNILPSKMGVQSTTEPIDLSLDGLCRRCVPKNPTIHRFRDANNRVVAVVEDVDECEAFEKSINERPAPLKIHCGIYAGTMQVRLHIELNLATLCHRAAGHLPREDLGMGVQQNLDRVSGGAQIVTGFTDSPGRFTPFETALQSLPNGNGEPLVLTSFARNHQSLRPDQEDCVRWMIDRETKPAPFIEKEIEEHHEKLISVRLLGWATRENNARGGILAHEVGFGKTVVTLALLDNQRFRCGDSIQERRALYGEGLLHAKATLIIVPHHIVGQWETEVKKFLGSSRA